jgi:hypothetical protein
VLIKPMSCGVLDAPVKPGHDMEFPKRGRTGSLSVVDPQPMPPWMVLPTGFAIAALVRIRDGRRLAMW